MWWKSPVSGVFGGIVVLVGCVVVGLWVLVLCLGFPYREAYLLGSGVSGVCRGCHRLGVDPNRNSLGMLPGGGGFQDSGFFSVPLPCGCGFLVGELGTGLASAGLFL